MLFCHVILKGYFERAVKRNVLRLFRKTRYFHKARKKKKMAAGKKTLFISRFMRSLEQGKTDGQPSTERERQTDRTRVMTKPNTGPLIS